MPTRSESAPPSYHSLHAIAWVLAPVGFVMGVAMQLQQRALWPLSIYVVVSLGPALSCLFAKRAVARHGPVWIRALLVALAALCVGFGSTGWRACGRASLALSGELEGLDLHVTGRVVGLPTRLPNGTRFDFVIDEWNAPKADTSDKPQLLPMRARLGWYVNGAVGDEQVPNLVAGQRWTFNVRLKAPHGNLNPGGFDYELWLWEQGIAATGSVRNGKTAAVPQYRGRTYQDPMARWRAAVRDRVVQSVPDPRAAGVIAALVVGDQAAIERGDWDVFRATGVAHLMSISGLHITAFAWFCMALIRGLWRRSPALCRAVPLQHAAVLGGVMLATFYAVFSGWGVPAQRTVLMLSVVLLLGWLGKRWPWPVVWVWATAVVCAWDPWALLQAGFWLSFVAVAVLMMQNPVIWGGAAGHADGGIPHAKRWRQAVQTFRNLGREQAVITFALAPLTLVLFGQVSVIGLLANLLAIPTVTLFITPASMLGVLWTEVWEATAVVVGWLMRALSSLAAIPFATHTAAQAPTWVGVLTVVGALPTVLRLPMSWRALAAFPVLALLLWRAGNLPPNTFELLAADVGQGSAVLVRTANHRLLYDAGPRYGPDADAGHRVLVPLLRRYDQPLDMIVLTHRDTDHTGGAAPVFAMQPQATLLGSLEPNHELLRGRAQQPCVAGQRWVWDGIAFEFVHPLGSVYLPDQGRTPKANALSCVLRIDDGRRVALLTGDIEAEQEAALVAREGERLRADLLLVPHHGSRTSSSATFLDAVSPRIGWIQSGYRNRFGHPSPTVLTRYRERGIAVYDTSRCGAITWSSDRTDEVRCERDASARYWHQAMHPR